MTASEFVLLLIALYFLPAFVAAVRFHPNKTAIFILNLLLGWTYLGWIAALVWSCTFVAPWSCLVQDTARDPRWANLRSTPMMRAPARHPRFFQGTTASANASDKSFYIGMTVWAGALLVVGVALIAGVK